MQKVRFNQIKTFLAQFVISGVLTGIFLYFFLQKLPIVFLLGVIIGGLVYTFIRKYDASIKLFLYQRIFFLALLNDFFFDLAEAVVATKGEIYKYVGDEAIITWKMKPGLKHNRCLECFFMMQEKVKANQQKYLNKYQLVPEFKAGMHGGEMGLIKKEIAYVGDVLNTTARIEASCNELGETFIVSDDLLMKMQVDTKFDIKSLGEIKFRGKETSVAVSSVRRRVNNIQ